MNKDTKISLNNIATAVFNEKKHIKTAIAGNTGESSKKELLEKLFRSFQTGITFKKASIPRDYLQDRGLDYHELQIGFNSGQFHHRKEDDFKEAYVKIGVLQKSNAPVNSPERTAYTCFGNYSIVFPLKDEKGDIVNLFAIRIKTKTQKAEYLNEEGIYPSYPKPMTKRLFIAPTVIDTASLLQSKVLENRDSVIALHDGELKPHQLKAIQQLTELQEIILINDHDQKDELAKQFPKVGLSILPLPENHSINDMLINYGSDGILDWMKENIKAKQVIKPQLRVIDETEFHFTGEELTYRITGAIPSNSTLLEMQFEIRPIHNVKNVLHSKIDLLDTKKVEEILFQFTEKDNNNYAQAVQEMTIITDELIKLRRESNNKEQVPVGINTKLKRQAEQILNKENLFEQLDELIEASGIIGEEKTRLMLFVLASSYKTKYNLHTVIHSTDKQAGAELVSKIAGLIPELEVYRIGETSSRSFRYYADIMINKKLLIIEDYDGVMSNNSINDLKKLQAKNLISSDAPKKNEEGNLITTNKTVESHSASIGATSKSKKHFASEPKTVVVGMDTSEKQLQRLLEQDCLKIAGLIDERKQAEARQLLRYIVENVHAQEVVNPFAPKLMLPANIQGARILTIQLLNFIALITLFKQRQRKMDQQGRMITEKQDVELGVKLFLDAIIVGVDELDTSTRAFFEKLKAHIEHETKGDESKKKTITISSLDIREKFNLPKTTVNRHLKTLLEFEYIKKEGYKNTGYTYKVVNWNDQNKVIETIKNKLGEQA